MSIQIENTDVRVEMEMNHRIQIQNENHELAYELKEQKAISLGWEFSESGLNKKNKVCND